MGIYGMTSEADRRKMMLSAGHWSCKPRTTTQDEGEAAAAAATQANEEALEAVSGTQVPPENPCGGTARKGHAPTPQKC